MLTPNDPNAHSYEHNADYYETIRKYCLLLLKVRGELNLGELKDEIHTLRIGYRVRKAYLSELLELESRCFFRRRGGTYGLTSAGQQLADLVLAQDGTSRYVIYKITNQKNGRCYIGQTSDIQRRIDEHFGQLRVGNHENHKLQNDYNLYGIEAFEAEILEKDLYPFERTAREVHYINLYDAVENGYNRQLPLQKKQRW